ncbi:hypothetical protein K435DRAFT_958965 [Dendrothele bispora CBS 962.96]|uniref:Small ribosomal subunit protein bS18m n=1 Tax=Dendrothele bispora (strain CBS 962.96) TaxID=1314807 RepID=A0A4S8MY64_DENBC|nr:hypothetical protein K435DRAFT_958965 [Dendrothele bispora CBS 962.96]
MLAVLRNTRVSLTRARPSLSAFFSTRRTPDNGDEEPIQELADKLVDESSISTSNFMPNPSSIYRSFEPYQFITPSRLTYESVVKRKAFPTKRAAVGPSKRDAQKRDPFHLQNVDPLDQALNPAIMNRFLTEMGKIMGRNVTGLTKKSQRRYGKAVRRAKMMGVIPVLSRRNIRREFGGNNKLNVHGVYHE